MRIRTRCKALRSAASVVAGRSVSAAVLFALLATGCADTSSGSDDSGGVADVSGVASGADVGPGDVGSLADLILGPDADTVATADTAPPGDAADTVATTDGGPPIDAAAPDTGEDAAVADAGLDAGTDTSVAQDTGGDADAMAPDAHGPDVAVDAADAGADVAGADVAGADVAGADIAGADKGCLEPTGVPCATDVDCVTDVAWQVCLEGECHDQDFGSEVAQQCCFDKYGAGIYDAPGCNPWGPPAPPAFDQGRAREALRGLA